MAGFGFSVGDFVAGINLVLELTQALKQGTRSGKEYQDLVGELDSLEKVLLEVHNLRVDASMVSKSNAIDQSVRQCQETMTAFCSKIDKYRASLSAKGSGNVVKDVLRKMQWSLYTKEDLRDLRAKVAGHKSSILMILLTSQQQHMTTSQKAASDDAANILTAVISLQRTISHKFISFERTVKDLMSTFKQFFQGSTKEVMQLNLKIYHTITEMQRIPPQVLCQQPVTFIDACGYQSPIHLEFINSWEAFEAVLKCRFEGKGIHKIERREYILEIAYSKKVINRHKSWDACIKPGETLYMDMLFKVYDRTEISICPGCRYDSKAPLEQEVDCDKCGLHYQRLDEPLAHRKPPLPKNQSPSNIKGGVTRQGNDKGQTGHENDILEIMEECEAGEEEVSIYRRVRLYAIPNQLPPLKWMSLDITPTAYGGYTTLPSYELPSILGRHWPHIEIVEFARMIHRLRLITNSMVDGRHILDMAYVLHTLATLRTEVKRDQYWSYRAKDRLREGIIHFMFREAWLGETHKWSWGEKILLRWDQFILQWVEHNNGWKVMSINMVRDFTAPSKTKGKTVVL